jgi:hypothetical protein
VSRALAYAKQGVGAWFAEGNEKLLPLATFREEPGATKGSA